MLKHAKLLHKLEVLLKKMFLNKKYAKCILQYLQYVQCPYVGSSRNISYSSDVFICCTYHAHVRNICLKIYNRWLLKWKRGISHCRGFQPKLTVEFWNRTASSIKVFPTKYCNFSCSNPISKWMFDSTHIHLWKTDELVQGPKILNVFFIALRVIREAFLF